MSLRMGELFAGYGGLGMGTSAVLDTEMVWYSEIDKGALKVLAHRFPDVPNIGDITTVDWSTVPRVDILTGGSPCQDLSHAGKRAGMTEGTRSNLWVAMREAIAQLQPRLVIWENVRGAYSAEADSDLVNDPRLLAGVRRRDGQPVLRALGRVVGDLSDLGYVGGWHGLRAVDVGPPHERFRVFAVAYPAGHGRPQGELARDSNRATRIRPSAVLDESDRGVGPLLPTPTAAAATGGNLNRSGDRSHELLLPGVAKMLALLPTPAVNDMGAAYTPEEWDAWTARMKAEHQNGNGHGKSLSVEAARLLPTPKTSNRASRKALTQDHHWTRPGLEQSIELADGHLPREYESDGEIRGNQPRSWAPYEDAIHRWEALFDSAPAPTAPGPKGRPGLNPRFVEWMMGLPAGWVTDVPGITRNEALKALGNGVVPQQAAAALRLLLASEVAA